MASSEAQFIVRYWGVRGSIPTPGPETVRYGGNTTCLEIRCNDTLLMIDSGTGARAFGGALRKEGAEHVRLFYSHHHLDHVQGFPFFLPIYNPACQIDVYSGAKPGTARQVLASQMAFPSFPVGLDSLGCSLDFHSFERGDTLEFGEVTVRTCSLMHPGGSTAFRIDFAGHSFVHASDHEHGEDGPHEELVELCRGADFLSYDATYISGEEYSQFKGWGHSTWADGHAVADAAGVDRFVVFHHDPSHDDSFMDQVAKDVAAARKGSIVAREGMVIDLLSGSIS